MSHVANMSKPSIIFPLFIFYPLILRNLALFYHQPLCSILGQSTLLGHFGKNRKSAGGGAKDVLILRFTLTDDDNGSWGL